MIFVSDRIEKIASSYPELTAIITEDETTVSYQQLNSQADRIAEMLIDILNLDNQSNFNETQMVGLLMERTIAIVTMFLAVHKAGCGYVPVDPAFPPDRQSYILEHSKCNVLIVDEECFEGARKQNLEIPARNIFISDSVGRIIKRCVDGREIPLNHGRRTIAPNTIRRVKELNRNAEAIAYVLYTSGSTGKPKGVAVKQIGVDNIIKFFADELEVGHSDCVMGLTTFCFDISVLETFVPLTRGATFLLAKSATRKDPFHIIELIEQHKVTVFQATPTTYEMMLATGWTGDERVKFLVGGEAFRPTILPLARKCSDLLNVYGPTETTIWSTFYRVPSDFDAYARSMNIKGVPIGKAISDTTLYLVEETQPWKQVPFGKEGELFIGGIGVAAGYLHAPHLTKERFIANPFGEGFVYRTGDSVKQLSDGNYIFMRRLDDQVKIDGFRIELEEIEKVFMQHEIVDKAVALVRDKKLVIYIQPKPQTPVKTVVRQSVLNSDDLDEEYELENDLLATILDFASKHLTYYMIPKYTMIVKEFPKTPNGKLDKKALPNPRSLLQHVSHEQTEKRSENETLKIQSFNGERPISSIICEAVHQLRGVRPQVGSSLSAFGLDSLGSVMLLRHLSTALQGEISIKMNDLFAVDATIKSIGQLLYSRANESVKMKLKLIPERDGDEENVLEEGEEDANNLVHRTDYFGAVLLSNRRLMDGLRGVFTLMVLFNHWHSSRTYLTSAFNVDTTLFYMISGFTTASQLRILPVIKKEKDGQLSTEPKPSLDLWNFFLIRAVGLYPILWISLLINAPTWQLQDKYQYPNHVAGLPQEEESAVCTFLYMIGMNVWTQTCTRRGPDVRYASGLIITMMIYALLRFLWTLVLRHFSSSTDLISLATRTAAFNEIISLKDRHQSWKEYLGKLSVYLSYNLYHPDVFWLYIIPYGFAVFLFSWQNTFSPIKLVTSVEYFGMCACLLVICEMMCGRRILRLQQQQREKEKEEIRLNPIQKSSTPLIKKGQERSTNIPEDLSSPWDEVRLRISPFVQQLRQQYHKQYQSFFGEISDPDERTMFLTATKRDKEEEEVELKSEDHQLNRETRNGGERRKISEWLWRFSPDLIMLFCMICFYLLSCYDEFCQSESIISLVEMALVPIAFLLYLTIALYQRGKERYNLSRLVLESDIMNKIGYASYPVYLIQNPFLQFYFTYVIHYPDYAYHPKQPGRHYFQRLPFVYRFTGILIVIVTGWLIQKYFQDWFITNLFTRLLSHWKSRRNNIPSQKRSI